MRSTGPTIFLVCGQAGMWLGVIHINHEGGVVDISRPMTAAPVHPKAASQLTQYTNHHFGTPFPSQCGYFWNKKPKWKKHHWSEPFSSCKIYTHFFLTHLITNGFACHPRITWALQEEFRCMFPLSPNISLPAACLSQSRQSVRTGEEPLWPSPPN